MTKSDSCNEKSGVLGHFFRFNIKNVGVVYGHVFKMTDGGIQIATTRGQNLSVKKSNIIDMRGNEGRVKL